MAKKKHKLIEPELLDGSGAGDDVIFADIEVERQVLRFVATKDVHLTQHLSESYFYGKPERLIFKNIKKIQGLLPKETLRKLVLKEVNEKDYAIADNSIDEIYGAEEIKDVAGVKAAISYLQGIAQQRIIKDAAEGAQHFNQQGDSEKSLNLFKEALSFNVQQTVETGDYLEDYEIRREFIEKKRNEVSNKAWLVPTGLRPFDEQAGGLLKGEVGVAVARTGGGKSVLKLNFGIAAWLFGYNVIHVGLEMTKLENQLRMDSALTNIRALAFRLGKLGQVDMKSWDKKIAAYRKERDNYIEFVSGRGMKMADILSLADGTSNRRGKKADLLILDHLALVQPKSERREFHLQMWDNMTDLSIWAIDTNTAVWTSTQSTDEGINRKGGMRVTDLKYSRGISETAQVIMAMYQDADDDISNDYNIKVIKGRGIKSGEKFTINPDFDRMILDRDSFLRMGVALDNRKKGKHQLGDDTW